MKGEQAVQREALEALRRIIFELDDIVRSTRFVPRRVRHASSDASTLAMECNPAVTLRSRLKKTSVLGNPDA